MKGKMKSNNNNKYVGNSKWIFMEKINFYNTWYIYILQNNTELNFHCNFNNDHKTTYVQNI